MEPWQQVLVGLAAFAAGMVNAVAGGGTLISFPTLVWVGRDPVIASATSTVALLPGSLSGMLGFRDELKGCEDSMVRLGVPALAGGALGAVLLLRTPSPAFAAAVPFLILFATLLMAAQGPLTRRLERGPEVRSDRWWWAGATVFQFLVGVYGGYFGAGIGILMLAALGFLGFTDLHQMNGLKNLFAICINGVAAAYFVASGAVVWLDVLVMVVGSVAGGYAGARFAYRVGRPVVRKLVVAVGLLMSVALFVAR